MKRIILSAGLMMAGTMAFAFSKIVKEESFHSSVIKNITAVSTGGNYTISKYSGDSVLVRISLECKDHGTYNMFMTKYAVNMSNTAGSLNIRTEKVPSTAGILTYEIFIPSDIPIDVSSEKSNVSVKDLKVQLKLNVLDGNFFGDNLSGTLQVTTGKLNMDIKANGLVAGITTKNSAINYSGKGGKLTLINASGKNMITFTAAMDADVQTTSGDIYILLPKMVECKLQATSIKKEIALNLEDIELKGTVTTNLLKATLGKPGANEVKLHTASGDIAISNVVMLSK